MGLTGLTGPLTLTILGCSGSYPGPGAPCSGYLVQAGGTNVVVDLGSGTLANLQQHIDLADIDAVVLSHCHPDHWVDLTVLGTAWKYGLGRTMLPVYGTAETRIMTEVVTGEIEPTLGWEVITDGSCVTIGRMTFSFSVTDHYVETLAVLVDDVEGGRSLVYSADTGPGWSIAAFGRAVDLALVEATMLADGEPDGILHLSARQAGTMAREAGARRLVLTHQSPGADGAAFLVEGEAAFGQPVDLAVPHARFEV